jgi:CheY-like chemotaxis protein/anti-sigma regulatory factor (Ser/Thr protein kinase)
MPTLLIVDDDAVDRELARRCVASIEDLEILEAENGEQALTMIAERAPDVVLTDLRMPVLDGLSLVRQATEQFPLVSVILMTSRGSEQIATEALLAGAASYVPKADLTELLAETLERVLTIVAARRERTHVLRHLDSSESRFELPNDPALIAPLVAYLQDDLERIGFADDHVRSQIGTALLEALSNAMIHGNLEVSSDLRTSDSTPYQRLIEERRQSEPWSSRRVHCSSRQSPGQVSFVIRDEGTGFDFSQLPDPTRPETMLKSQGRGLYLIHAFMDEVEHNQAGNQIQLTKWAPE